MSKSLGSMISLAVELKLAIFHQLSDVGSARALALTSKGLYLAYESSSSEILCGILDRQIPAGAQNEALIALEIVELPYFDEQLIQHCTAKFAMKGRRLDSRVWDYSRAKAVQRLHDDILFFARDMKATMLTLKIQFLNDEVVQLPPGELTASETIRLIKAFYRLEVWRLIFRLDSPVPQGIERAQFSREAYGFTDNFEPYEIEQMACVDWHLAVRGRQAWKRFESINQSINDAFPEQRSWMPDYQPFWHCLISFGLGFLRAFIEARLPLNLIQAALEHGLSDTRSTEPSEMLRGNKWGTALVSLTSYMNESGRFLDSGDAGPIHMWAWAYHGIPRDASAFDQRYRTLQQLGYVLLDFDRIQAWGIMSSPARTYMGSNLKRWDPGDCPELLNLYH